jgi:hypothetical protein
MGIKKISKYGAFGTLIVLLIVLAVATVVEKLFGSEVAQEQIYGAWWCVVLWAILGISSVIYILLKTFPHYQLSIVNCQLFLHFSLVIILLGGLTTYLTGERGYVHIRQGEIANFFYSEKDAVKHPFPFSVKLLLFNIEYHPDTDAPADYISFLKIDEEVTRVSMNRIFKRDGYRLYQIDYDRDEMGTTLLVSHDPWGIGITYTGYIMLGLSMLLLLFGRIGWKGVLLTLVPVAGLGYSVSQMNPMTPVLRSPMLAVHVSVIMVAYLLILTMMLFSLIALCKKKYREKFYRWNTLLLYPAIFLLAAGIFFGAVWANISWGRYWGWDAKETWALITLLVYALPLHKDSFPFFRNPKNFHLYCLIAFLTILMTFLGVSYLLGGMHSYI